MWWSECRIDPLPVVSDLVYKSPEQAPFFLSDWPIALVDGLFKLFGDDVFLLCRSSKSNRVRAAAVNRLEDEEQLAKIAKTDEDGGIRRMAEKRLKELRDKAK